MLTDKMINAFNEAPLCYIATTSEAGPNVVSIGFKWIYDGQLLLLADLFLGKTRNNIDQDPRVSIAIATPNPKEGFQFRGTATLHRTGEPYEELCRLLNEKGLAIKPYAAIMIEVTEAYVLDPGDKAGLRIF